MSSEAIEFGVHDECDVLEEAGQGLEFAHRAHELLEVLEPALRLGAPVVLPHLGVARFIENDLGELGVGQGVDERSPAPERLEQGGERRPRLRRELVGKRQRLGGTVQRRVLGSCVLVHALDRRVADAALRRVDDALEGEVVVGRCRDLQIGECIPDFLPLVEARTADDAIRQAEGDEPVFEGSHLERCPHQDGDVVEPVPGALQAFDVVADGARFLVAVPMAAHHDLETLHRVGAQGLAEPALVLGDEPGRGAEDVRRGAVVAFEPDDRRAREVLLEPEDVVDLGAAPAIDRLVVVADAADVAMPLGEQPEPQILGDIGVLVFVDQHVAETALVVGEHVRMILEDAQHFEQEVAEVAAVQDLQALLVLGIDDAALAVREARGLARRHLVRKEPAVLPAVDQSGDLARRPSLLVDAVRLEQLFQQAHLVIGVEDGEARLESGEFGMSSQDLHSDRVERAEPRHALDDAADEIADAVLHLARRLVGESDGENLARPGPARRQDMGEPRRQDARLARAGACQDEKGSVQRLDRQTLLRIEALEIGRLRAHQRPCGDATLRLAGRQRLLRRNLLTDFVWLRRHGSFGFR